MSIRVEVISTTVTRRLHANAATGRSGDDDSAVMRVPSPAGRRLFQVFETYRTPVDVVTTSEVSVSVTVDDDRQLGEIVTALEQFAEVIVDRDMAILCAVGDNLRTDPRLAIRLLSVLEGVPLRMVSQAASRRNVTVVLSDRDVAAAMARLHDAAFAASGTLGTTR